MKYRNFFFLDWAKPSLVNCELVSNLDQLLQHAINKLSLSCGDVKVKIIKKNNKTLKR